MSEVAAFLSGGVTVLYAVAGLFFLRFWLRARDVLFLSFAAAFFLLAVNQAAAGFWGPVAESQAILYSLRMVGFLLIAAAILAKNISRQ